MSTEQQAEEPKPREWPFVVTLKHPIEFGGEHISSLTFQRGRLGFLKGVPIDTTPPLDKMLIVAGRLCGQLPAMLEMLHPDDSPVVLEITLDFWQRCLAVGSTP